MACSVILIAALLAASAAAAQQAADPQRGRTMAERWCANCHLVQTSQPRGTDGVPTFAAIARGRDWTEASFAAALLAPHPPMPEFSLTRRELADLLAFLRQQGR